MQDEPRILTLSNVLRGALDKQFPDCMLYLPRNAGLTTETKCLLLTDWEGEKDELGIPLAAVKLGFYHEGLESIDIEDAADRAKQLADPPSDALLLESFIYYWRFDAFLPHAGAREPPGWPEMKRRMDREYYETLGAERADHPCGTAGCGRGAIHNSDYCRVHHFAMVKHEQCPFSD